MANDAMNDASDDAESLEEAIQLLTLSFREHPIYADSQARARAPADCQAPSRAGLISIARHKTGVSRCRSRPNRRLSCADWSTRSCASWSLRSQITAIAPRARSPTVSARPSPRTVRARVALCGGARLASLLIRSGMPRARARPTPRAPTRVARRLIPCARGEISQKRGRRHPDHLRCAPKAADLPAAVDIRCRE